MSFINLMGNDVWSDTDIVNRTEAMIAQHFSPAAAEILRRKVMGQMLGAYSLTPAEQADLFAYQTLAMQAGIDADDARADMALLTEVMSIESGNLLFENASASAQSLATARAAARSTPIL